MKIKIKVHANSSQEKIVRISEKEFEIWIREKPLDGKANAAIEKFLKRYLGRKCEIVSGFKSNMKSVEVHD